jgi:hypothetical protein
VNLSGSIPMGKAATRVSAPLSSTPAGGQAGGQASGVGQGLSGFDAGWVGE